MTMEIGIAPERVVRYVARSGEVRRAIVALRGAGDVIEDRPLQDILREEYRQSPDMLREVILAARGSELPGFLAFNRMVSKLAEGTAKSFVLREDEQDTDGPPFGAVLQSLEVAAIPKIERGESESPLDFVADGKPVMVAWRLEGEPPRRLLSLSAARPTT